MNQTDQVSFQQEKKTHHFKNMKSQNKIIDYKDGHIKINGVIYYRIEDQKKDPEFDFCTICGWGDVYHESKVSQGIFIICHRHG